MKRLTMLILVCTCVLVPAQARADDGGWWDWLWKWDPKMMGVSSEIHVLCLDKDGQKVRKCEEWFTNLGRLLIGKSIEHKFNVLNRTTRAPESIDFDKIKHEIDFRFGYFHNYGSRYDAATSSIPPADGSIQTLKLMGVYNYHLNTWSAVSGGVGYLPVWGDRIPGVLSRAIVTGGLVIYPFPGARAFALRPEVSWIPKGFTAADFGDNPAIYPFSHEKEVTFSVAIGVDLRRIGNNP